MPDQINTEALEFTVSERWGAYCKFLDIVAPFGSTSLIIRPNERRMTISGFDVAGDCRRQGIGKALLQRTLEEARSRNIKLIVASIISRECIDAMTNVFGESAVYIHELGNYHPNDMAGQQGDAKAVLLYRTP